jgi:hypothetical protein
VLLYVQILNYLIFKLYDKLAQQLFWRCF